MMLSSGTGSIITGSDNMVKPGITGLAAGAGQSGALPRSSLRWHTAYDTIAFILTGALLPSTYRFAGGRCAKLFAGDSKCALRNQRLVK